MEWDSHGCAARAGVAIKAIVPQNIERDITVC